jgi:hypothetical protein
VPMYSYCSVRSRRLEFGTSGYRLEIEYRVRVTVCLCHSSLVSVFDNFGLLNDVTFAPLSLPVASVVANIPGIFGPKMVVARTEIVWKDQLHFVPQI